MGPDPTRGRAGLPLLQVGVAAGLSYLPQLSGGVPRGYLRVLVFNADSALVSQQVQQLSSAALNNYERLRVQVLVPQDGYVSAFVGNESDADVLFDDVTVELRQGLQVQETQYDPTGLEMAGLTGTTPGLKSLSQYKFNGKENQLDLGLNWNHHDARFYDYQIGRWHVVDPLSDANQEAWSTYQFGFNNAVTYNDLDGKKVNKLITSGTNTAQQQFALTANIGLGGLYNTNINSKTGEVSLERTSKDGRLNQQQRALYNSLNNAIKSKSDINISLVESDSQVEIGSFYSQSIDVVDVSKLPNSSLEASAAISAQGALTHEVTEQTSKQTKNSNLADAHKAGMNAENKVNNSTRKEIGTFQTVDVKGNPAGQAIQSKTTMGTAEKTVNILTVNGNVTGTQIK